MQQRLLEFFITVFSQELSDAYLNTLFEQVHDFYLCIFCNAYCVMSGLLVRLALGHPMKKKSTHFFLMSRINQQEVHNSVCMSQELARRCIWIQESAISSPNTSGSVHSESSITERENRRRVNAVQKILKVVL